MGSFKLIKSKQLLYWLVVAYSILTAVAAPNNETDPISAFNSRRDLSPPAFNITLNQPEATAPGYYFVAAYGTKQNAPYIYDIQGNLIWSGYDAAINPDKGFDLQVNTYRGRPHLSFWQGSPKRGYGQGKARILDNHYTLVKEVNSVNDRPKVDLHEIKVLSGQDRPNTVLMTVYQPTQYNWTDPGTATTELIWIVQSIFQEVDLDTNKLLFEWNSLDHVTPSLSYVPINGSDLAGDGLSAASAWDYFHINSVDKTPEGDYLVSSRHTNTIYRIYAADKSIAWRLGGKQSTFSLHNFNFSSQHDARLLSSSATTSTISFFNNAADGATITSPVSSGMIVSLDHSNQNASLTIRLLAPGPGLLSRSQGNVQSLPNGNYLVGWGANAYISEHAPNGTCLMFANMGLHATVNYRAFKFSWIGRPVDPPRIDATAASTASSTTTEVSISWNGDTEVRTWEVWTGDSQKGVFRMAKRVARDGFETTVTLNGFKRWTYARAIGDRGCLLGASAKTPTLIENDPH